MAYSGTFRPKNPQKYKGDYTNIIYRSSWELKLMMWFDTHPDVLEWSSEEIIIPYRSPIDGKVHRYFPDFYVRKRNKDGIIETIIVEVKPYAQTQEPKKQKKVSKSYINEVKTWGINSYKWKAARDYCEDRKWKFQIITEKELGIKY
jgi:hypothetical protein